MKFTAFFSLLFYCFSTTAQDSLYTPTPLLSEHPFHEGGYSLVLLSMNGYRGVDTTNHFYTQDIDKIKEIQQNLIGTEPATVYPFACFESNILLMCKDGKILETVSFSDNCRAANSAKSPKYGFAYSSLELSSNLNLKTKLCQFRHKFANRLEGQKFLDSIRQDTNLVLVTPEDWMQYEGKFGFFYKSESFYGDEIEALLQETLQRTFPKEKFQLEASNSGGSSETMYNFHVMVHCNKSLYEQFKLYPIDGNQWQKFSIFFDSYWR